MIKVNIVSWKPPFDAKYKLNTDGSVLTNLGKIGGVEFLEMNMVVSYMHLLFLLGKVPPIRQKFKQHHMD